MKFSIVDIETTGDSPKNFKVIEIAIIIHDGKNELETFHTFVDPGEKINPFVARLTGISDNDLIGAPKFFEIAKKIIEFTRDTIFVAHNVSFDYGVLRTEYRRLGFDFRMDHLDTVQTTKILFPGYKSYGLKNITRDLGIELTKHHRAIDDTKATALLFNMLFEKDPQNLQSFIRQEINPSALNPKLKLEQFDDVPNKTGVYKFYNENSELIYIGKSIHIKKRIEQHLKNTKTQKGLELRLKIAAIDHELTGSELIALLKESEEIKLHKPVYNRAQKNSVFSHGLFMHEDQAGYKRFTIKKTSSNDQPVTTFTSIANAKATLDYWVSEYQLCQKMCNQHDGINGCFNYSIKKCEGACVGAESPEVYNQRVEQLLSYLNFNSSSFLILDKGRNSKESSFVWIHQGQYRGYGFAFRYLIKRDSKNFKKFLIPQTTNRDFQSIIRMQMEKDEKLEIIQLDQ
ncbi:MAG: GIY-YIG nuclease family protein [Crocinitomicaceae bacterium]|nr:GIY-YIG nuclease family protein [Crocinitomicaceae bacterium]